MKLTPSGYPVIDLKANYGADRYRVKRDDCNDQLIPHKWGHFYAHSATELACFIKGRHKFTNIRRQFPDIQVTQEGDQEIIFVFDPQIFPGLAKALKASRKKQISQAVRDQLLEMGRATQFRRDKHGSRSALTDHTADLFPLPLLGYGSAEKDALEIR